MPEMHLSLLGLTYITCGLFMKNKEKIQKFKETQRFTIYLLKRIFVNFSTWHGLWIF